jgi:hypothetical protein
MKWASLCCPITCWCTDMALFQPGQPKTPGSGRARGVKNRLSHAFLQALAEDFEQHGAEAIKIFRVEKPNEYLRVIAHCLPKELAIEIGPLQEISDLELETLIANARNRLIDVTPNAGGGEEPEAEREPARLLQTISSPTRIS